MKASSAPPAPPANATYWSIRPMALLLRLGMLLCLAAWCIGHLGLWLLVAVGLDGCTKCVAGADARVAFILGHMGDYILAQLALLALFCGMRIACIHRFRLPWRWLVQGAFPAYGLACALYLIWVLGELMQCGKDCDAAMPIGGMLQIAGYAWPIAAIAAGVCFIKECTRASRHA